MRKTLAETQELSGSVTFSGIHPQQIIVAEHLVKARIQQ
jgi:hypothetical protein